MVCMVVSLILKTGSVLIFAIVITIDIVPVETIAILQVIFGPLAGVTIVYVIVPGVNCIGE